MCEALRKQLDPRDLQERERERQSEVPTVYCSLIQTYFSFRVETSMCEFAINVKKHTSKCLKRNVFSLHFPHHTGWKELLLSICLWGSLH